jgi:hypothetical protein
MHEIRQFLSKSNFAITVGNFANGFSLTTDFLPFNRPFNGTALPG